MKLGAFTVVAIFLLAGMVMAAHAVMALLPLAGAA